MILTATQLLALCITGAFLFWLIFLQRRVRTVMEPSRPKTDVLLLDCMLPPRPAVWLAVRASDPRTVQAALGMNRSTPCSWSEGMKGSREFFIGPPVNGWIIVTGSGLPNPSCDVDECYRILTELSRKLGQVQFFQADRVLHHHAWVRAEDGVVTRAYAWAGETIWNQGEKTPAEIALTMKCFGYGDDPNADLWAAVQWTAANVGKVPLLAARWSLDPARINARTLKYASGIAGESPRVN
jgi:hypothetical protein